MQVDSKLILKHRIIKLQKLCTVTVVNYLYFCDNDVDFILFVPKGEDMSSVLCYCLLIH